MLIHVARRSYIAFAYPPSCSAACFLVYRLHALHAGTALVCAYPCCRRDRLPLWRMGLPLLLSTCVATGLPTHASFHVNVYALITPPPWSILSLFQPPLQRTPSVVTGVTLASTYCSFLVCGDRQEFRESPFVRPETASLSFAVCSICPVMARGPSSERELRRRPSDQLPLVSFAHLYGARPRRVSLSLPFCAICPVMAHGPSLERALCRRPSYHLPFVSFAHLYGARPEQASFSLPFCPIMARGPSGPAYHCLSV